MSSIQQNTIGKDFTIPELIKFTAFPVFSQLFISLLRTLDDSLFLSRYVGQNALAAFSICLPWFMIVDGFSMFMSAVSIKSSMLLGEKKDKEAKEAFTTIAVLSFGIGLIIFLVMTFFRRDILIFLGATETLLPYCLAYTNISRFHVPLSLVNQVLNRFYTVSGRPKYGVMTTVVNTICNFACDYIFIVKLNYGIAGAAIANTVGHVVVFILGMLFFFNKKHEIYFTGFSKNWMKLLKDVFSLGGPQAITSLALSLNSFIANLVLLKYGQETYVAAYSIVNNVQFMFMTAYFGLYGAISPIVSYAYGEKNQTKLARILKQETILVSGLTVIIMVLYIFGKDTLMSFYLMNAENEAIRDIVALGMSISVFAFPVFGYNVMVQEVANSVGNTKTSTFLSTMENIILADLSILLLPKMFGANAIWYAFFVTESITFIFTLIAVYQNRNVYGYGKDKIATFTQQ